MLIRKYRDKDKKILNLLLFNENVQLSAVGKDYSLTWVAERDEVILGMFTLTLKQGVIFLQHFIVIKEAKRSLSRIAYKLIKYLENMLQQEGVNRFIIDLNRSRQDVCYLVERYFNSRIQKIKQISVQNEIKVYYFVEI